MAPKVSYSKKVVEAYKALSNFAVLGGKGMPPHYPFSVIETNWYYSQFLPRELLQLFDKLAKKGVSTEKMAKLFWGPSTLSHMFWIADFPFKGLTAKQSEAFIEKTIELISTQREKDIFCRDSKNILLSSKEVEKIRNDASFVPITERLVESVERFNITMWHYCILIQIGHRAYSQEFHGLYKLKSGETVFIRDFFNLKPAEVWDFVNLPFEKLRVIEVYKKDVGLKINMFNLYTSSVSLAKNTVEIALSVNDKYVKDKKQLFTIYGECEKALKAGNKVVAGFTKPDWIKKIIGMRYHWLKPTKELLGEDRKPPKSLYNLANKTKLAERESMHWVKNMQAAVMNLPPDKAIKKVTQLFLNNIYQLC